MLNVPPPAWAFLYLIIMTNVSPRPPLHPMERWITMLGALGDFSLSPGRVPRSSSHCVGDRFKARRRQPNDVCGPTAASGAAGARRSIACCLVEAPAPRQADSRSRPFSPLHLALAEQWRQDQWTVVDQTPAEPPSILRRSRSQCV